MPADDAITLKSFHCVLYITLMPAIRPPDNRWLAVFDSYFHYADTTDAIIYCFLSSHYVYIESFSLIFSMMSLDGFHYCITIFISFLFDIGQIVSHADRADSRFDADASW